MYNADQSRTTVYVVSHQDDIPETMSGFLIPEGYVRRARTSAPHDEAAIDRPTYTGEPLLYATVHRQQLIVAVSGFAVMCLLAFGLPATLPTASIAAAPILNAGAATESSAENLALGPQTQLGELEVFAASIERLRSQSFTFIAANLADRSLTLYVEGEPAFTAPIRAVGNPGSWWDTPAGFYEITDKAERHNSTLARVYNPWSLRFDENFSIHGWPKRTNGTPVPESYPNGSLRLSDEDAAALYELTPIGTPVLIHKPAVVANDDFIYEPKAPEVTATQYLVADLETETVLAAHDIESAVPIASLAKLMTALVAAEELDLDTQVRVSQEQYVTTLVPRLDGRYRVSMYSPLQLLLVESSNEAAEVIAAQLGREQFIARMNEKALALGLTDTRFADPSGLDDGNTSSVGDLFKLAKYIRENRNFIFELTYRQRMESAELGGDFGDLTNFNLVEGVESFVGGKVGETMAAGQTSVSIHELTIDNSPRTLVFIVLGSRERNADIAKLEHYVLSRYSE